MKKPRAYPGLRGEADETYLAVLALRDAGCCVRRDGNKHVIDGVRTSPAMLRRMAELARRVRQRAAAAPKAGAR